MISAIRWVSEIVGIAGGDDVFAELSVEAAGKDRIVADANEVIRRDPQLIVGSWCGKRFRPEKVAARAGWDGIDAGARGAAARDQVARDPAAGARGADRRARPDGGSRARGGPRTSRRGAIGNEPARQRPAGVARSSARRRAIVKVRRG